MNKQIKKSLRIKSKSDKYEMSKTKKQFTNVNCIGAMNDSLIEYSWSIGFNHEFKHKPKPFSRPRLKQIIPLISAGLRLLQQKMFY